MKLASAALLLPLAALAQGDALFDDIAPADAPSSPAPAPFSEWDGVTQLFPKPHAESAKSAELNLDLELMDTGGQSEFVDNPTTPSLSLVGEFALPDSAPEGLSGIAWTYMPDCAGRPVDYSTRMPDGTDVFAPDSYALCEDSGGRVHWASIALDPESGAVNSVVFRASWNPVGVAATADLEAIAYKRNTNRRCALFLSDEASAHVYRRRLSPHGDYDAGACVMSATLPDPLQSPRRNKGVEAMCLSPDNDLLWVANEDSLPEDGPVATTEHGSRVRLYALDASDRRWPHEAPRWWFYPLDPAVGSPFPHLPDPFNGLAELCALPDGRLLALERTYGLRTRSADDPRASLIAISIYLVDPLHAEANPHAEAAESKPHAEAAESKPHAEAAESKPHAEAAEAAESKPHAEFAESKPHAEAAEFAESDGAAGEARPAPSDARTAAAERPPVLAKTLLWRGLTGRANYEGMTLGPELSDGSRALILVSDGDVTRRGAFAFPWSKRLLSLRLRLPDTER